MSNTKFIGITDELKGKFKALLAEFNVIPQPVTPAPVVAAPVVTEPVKKFGEAKTKDGTIIKWEGDAPYAVGTVLMVIDPANPEGFLPAPDGEVVLEDGTVLTIEGGAIKEIKPAAPAAPEVPAVPAMPDMSKQFAEVEQKFADLKKEKEDSEKALRDEIAKLTGSVKQMFSLLGEAMETPTANPIEDPKNVDFSKMTKKERLIYTIHGNK